MNKYLLLGMLRRSGEAFLTINGEPQLCTVDFSTKYIRKKRRGYIQIPKDKILAFSWSKDTMILINPSEVTKMEPLQRMLKNRRP